MLVPGARSEEKRWSEDRFAEIGQWVVDQAGGSVVVCGAPSESKLVRSVVKATGKNAKGYALKDLGTLLALIDSADAVVSNDTGPMHFAFLSNVPTVAIFTHMSPLVWGPHRTDHRFVVLNPPEPVYGGPMTVEAEGAWTRLAIHHLDGLLGSA